ncbi:MAG: deoxyribose-phosphate aldolase [Lachnospiraceae bacterium]|jgi:deoxyribose-phosphate aldolase|nr:deoxyribose-phosphate aldolase [Lachnospiraceae bacterium]
MKNPEKLTVRELAAMMDHTLLKAYAVKDDFKKLCGEAAENGFAMVAINSSQVRTCKEFLKGTNIHVGAAISFPLGQTEPDVKVFETKKAIEDGADEIDYVINIGELKMGHDDYIRREMEAVVKVCRENHVLSKVIFENCYLTKEEIVRAAKIAGEVKPDFIKTSTGFGTSGADAEDVRLMKQTVGDAVKVKAAGGIRDWETCKKMLEAGAERIGTSSSIKICEEFRREREGK